MLRFIKDMKIKNLKIKIIAVALVAGGFMFAAPSIIAHAVDY